VCVSATSDRCDFLLQKCKNAHSIYVGLFWIFVVKGGLQQVRKNRGKTTNTQLVRTEIMELRLKQKPNTTQRRFQYLIDRLQGRGQHHSKKDNVNVF